MEFRRMLALLLVLVSAAALGQAYRWVDEDGVVHYSDRYVPGAEQIVLQDSNTVRMQVPQTRPRDDGDAGESTARYQSLSIQSPAAEETLWNIGGTLNVSLSLSPSLMPGHRVQVYFDGEPQTFTSTNFTLNEVYRGVHNIQAEILDESGNMLIRSQTNRFYVQQNSVITPPTAAPGVNRPQTAP